MKLMKLTLGLLSFSGLLTFAPSLTHSVSAQCVQADVSVQYNISGSKRPTKRSNDVVMESEGSCTGNTSVTTGVQGNIGGNRPVEQHRRVRHRQVGGSDNPSGIGGRTIQQSVNVQADVYNPADNFKYKVRD